MFIIPRKPLRRAKTVCRPVPGVEGADVNDIHEPLQKGAVTTFKIEEWVAGKLSCSVVFYLRVLKLK